jgi:hypothetical protein
MKNIVIINGADYRIMYGNELAVLEALPASIYEVQYEKEKGFFLTRVDGTFTVSETLYGDVEALTGRVMYSFERTEGNLGVPLSGPKGLGKTLTVKNICKTAPGRNLPVIMVKEHFDNIVSFIDTVCQPCVAVLDEFEKLYPDHRKTEQDDFYLIRRKENMPNHCINTLTMSETTLPEILSRYIRKDEQGELIFDFEKTAPVGIGKY